MSLANCVSNEKTKEVRAAIYCRLSKDDDLSGESASIGNQRELLLRYCDENGFRVCGVYQDDGWSGTRFDRPSFMDLLEEIEQGNVSTVCLKDLYRIERSQLSLV